MTFRRAGALLLLASLIVGACANDDEPGARPRPSPEPSPTPVAVGTEPDPSCPNQQDALASEPESSLEGDVDGDGAPDEVSLVKDDEGEVGCEAFIVVRSADAILSVPIVQQEMSSQLGLPTLRGLVELDGDDGFEIVLALVAGASTEFFGAWRVADGELARVAVEGGVVGDLLPSGGSVGHVEASDCTEDGIVISSGVPEGDGYRIDRTFYAFEQGRFVELRTEEETIGGGAGFDRFPEFVASPLGSCQHV